MNEILQQRIEEARKNYENSLALPDWDRKEIHGIDFMKGANFVLQNQWISVEEALPPCIEGKHYSEHCFCREQCEGYVTNSIQSYVYGETNHWAHDHEYVTHWMPIPQLKGGEK